jgi:mannose-6-phosphate isomerase-like protein (cupin superfamily)
MRPPTRSAPSHRTVPAHQVPTRTQDASSVLDRPALRWRTARTDIVLLATAGELHVEFPAERSSINEGEFTVVRAGERYRLAADQPAEVIALYGTTVVRPRVETIELGPTS